MSTLRNAWSGPKDGKRDVTSVALSVIVFVFLHSRTFLQKDVGIRHSTIMMIMTVCRDLVNDTGVGVGVHTFFFSQASSLLRKPTWGRPFVQTIMLCRSLLNMRTVARHMTHIYMTFGTISWTIPVGSPTAARGSWASPRSQGMVTGRQMVRQWAYHDVEARGPQDIMASFQLPPPISIDFIDLCIYIYSNL